MTSRDADQARQRLRYKLRRAGLRNFSLNGYTIEGEQHSVTLNFGDIETEARFTTSEEQLPLLIAKHLAEHP